MLTGFHKQAFSLGIEILFNLTVLLFEYSKLPWSHFLRLDKAPLEPQKTGFQTLCGTCHDSCNAVLTCSVTHVHLLFERRKN